MSARSKRATSPASGVENVLIGRGTSEGATTEGKASSKNDAIGSAGDSPPHTLAYSIERSLTRWGNWGKKLALVGLVHRSLGELGPLKSAGLFAFSTFWSTWKILHDFHPPHGTRRYVANLCGDDAAVKRIRDFPETCAPWDTCQDFLLSRHKGIWSKALAAGWCSFSRNLDNGTLYLYWTYTIAWKVYAYVISGGKGGGFLKTVFPQGVLKFVVAQARTCGLLYSFGFSFWVTLGLASKYRITSTGLSRNLTAVFVTIAATISLPIETTRRWQALAAFMTMTIFD